VSNNKFKLVALLPIKGNSERVPGKNFKIFGGRPLFQWVLNKLLEIDEIDAVVINTDAEDLLLNSGLPSNKKIIIRNRKQEICGDMVSMNRVIQDDVLNIDSALYLMTHTTNPFISKETIVKSISVFKHSILKDNKDSLFTVNKVQERFYDANAKAINHDPNNLIRTQDLTPWYQENSNLYLFTKESFSQTNARIGSNPAILVTAPYESTDIDTPSDWELGEVMIEYYKKKGLSNDS